MKKINLSERMKKYWQKRKQKQFSPQELCNYLNGWMWRDKTLNEDEKIFWSNYSHITIT